MLLLLTQNSDIILNGILSCFVDSDTCVPARVFSLSSGDLQHSATLAR